MTKLQDQSLAQAAAGGDQDSLAKLLEQYQQRVYNVCLKMLSNRDDAAESAQDALVKIIEHISGFKGESNISTWIIRIAMNSSISRLRRRKVRQAASLETATDDQAATLRSQLADSREQSPESGVEKKEMLAMLRQAMAEIDEEFRSVLVLRDMEGMDYQQIGQVLDLPIGTVKSRLFRARLALRQEMFKLCPPTEAAGKSAE